MQRRFGHYLMALAFALLCVSLPGNSPGAEPKAPVVSRFAEIDGIKLHYLTAGRGSAVVLLHGYTQTSRMWTPLIPLLADKFTVIAPDLPGIGESDVPSSGLDLVTAAERVHGLIKSLGLQKVRIVGHDIGLMVAYAYAARFAGEVERLVVMDAFLPGVAGWETVYDSPGLWHFRFHGPTPEALVQGRERTYFEYYWNEFAADKNHSIPEGDRIAYTAAYARPGRMHAGWAYFATFPQTAEVFAELSKTRIAMPVLALGGDKANGNLLAQQMKRVASQVTVVILKDTGHWIMEEKPKETMDALARFL